MADNLCIESGQSGRVIELVNQGKSSVARFVLNFTSILMFKLQSLSTDPVIFQSLKMPSYVDVPNVISSFEHFSKKMRLIGLF